MTSPSDSGVPTPIPGALTPQIKAQAGKSSSVSEGVSLQDSLSKLNLPAGVDPSLVPPIPWEGEKEQQSKN